MMHKAAYRLDNYRIIETDERHAMVGSSLSYGNAAEGEMFHLR